MKERIFGIILVSIVIFLLLINLASAGLGAFDGVVEVNKVMPNHPNYLEISQQYPIFSSELYEVTYHIKTGWNFLPYPILNGRDAVTGKATCWKQDDQRGNIQATNLNYVYMYEPNASILPDNHIDYYVGGRIEDWSSSPLSDYQKSIWSISEPNKQNSLPVNWVYSSENCDFLFYTYWLDSQNYKETSDALRAGTIPCTEDYCPLRLEEGWQVVLQLFPGFSWEEIKGDCIIEKVNFWDSTAQVYALTDSDSSSYLEGFMSQEIGVEDYFKPILMKINKTCTLGKVNNYACEKVVYSGNSDDKIDLIYIPDSYNNNGLWIQDVEAFNEKFFDVEPMKEYKNKFNIWRVDLPDNYSFDRNSGDSYLTGNAQNKVKSIARDCVDLDVSDDTAIVINKNLDFGAEGGDIIDLGRTREFNGKENLAWPTLIHEFGHFIANLGDEYENTGSLFDMSERPNVDLEGCPKWCSGVLNQTVYYDDAPGNVYLDYINFKECLYNATNNLTRDYTYGSCNYPWYMTEVNFGTGCLESTGCYWNAKSLISFRSSRESIMRHPDTEFEFNLISKEAIISKLNTLN